MLLQSPILWVLKAVFWLDSHPHNYDGLGVMRKVWMCKRKGICYGKENGTYFDFVGQSSFVIVNECSVS